MGTLRDLIESIHREAARAEFPIDAPVYEKAAPRPRRAADCSPSSTASATTCTRCSGDRPRAVPAQPADPWRLVLSTDHPNGGSFLSYPRLIRLLMDREFRNEQIRR